MLVVACSGWWLELVPQKIAMEEKKKKGMGFKVLDLQSLVPAPQIVLVAVGIL
jgi:hypothetical protein